jgi:predicted dehydrogenase
MQIGIIGCGRIVQNSHLPALLQIKDAKVSALCDVDESHLTSASALLPDRPSLYRCYRQFLSEAALEAVLVAVPHAKYPEVVEECVRSGLRTIKEKPFATSPAEARALHRMITRNNGLVFTVCQKRFNPIYRRLRELIAAPGDPVRHVSVRYAIPSQAPNAGWRGESRVAGGGVWLDMGHHVVDLLAYLFEDQPIRVRYARLINTCESGYDVDDIALVDLECAGIPVSVFISCVDPDKAEKVVVTRERSILEATKSCLRVRSKTQSILEELSIADADPASFDGMLRHALYEDGRAFADNLKRCVAIVDVITRAQKMSRTAWRGGAR